MAKIQVEKLRLSMAGEYSVCAELLKRGHIASITVGNAKAVDSIDLSLYAGVHTVVQLLYQSFQPLGGHFPMTARLGSQLLCPLVVNDSLDFFCSHIFLFSYDKGNKKH